MKLKLNEVGATVAALASFWQYWEATRYLELAVATDDGTYVLRMLFSLFQYLFFVILFLSFGILCATSRILEAIKQNNNPNVVNEN